MQLDPQARAVLADIAAAGTPPYRTLGVAASRELYRASCRALGAQTVEPARVRDASIACAHGSLALRLYRPVERAPDAVLPGVVYFHGGGWVLGDLDTHDGVCRALANMAECVVVAVDYRLAPEHKFPAAVDDALDAVRWTAREAQTLRIDPTRLAVAGDSAGATLATVAALALRDAGGPTLSMQVLIYPAVDMDGVTSSHEEFAEGYGLTRENMSWFREMYLSASADARDWRASPLRAPDLSGLPRTYIIAAGFDPLRDEARLYTQRLQDAGVAVTHELFEGMIHGFLVMGGVIAAARHAIYRIAQALRPEPDRGFRRAAS